MERFIDPKTLARIKDLSLVAKTVAEGFLHGLQSSRQRGVGTEFSQYRAYETGDELSRIDWKLFARSDRYFVREAERESEIDVWLLLDASRSMLQRSEVVTSKRSSLKSLGSIFTHSKNVTPDLAEPSWSKFDYAKNLIASIGYLAQKQGDSIGYLGMSSESLNFLPAGNNERQWRKLLQELAHTESGQYFPAPNLIQKYIGNLQKPAIIFVISDFNQREQEITDFLSKLNSSRCEVVALQLVCSDEVHFNYQGTIRFKDLETDKEILVSAANIKTAYQANYRSYQQQINAILTQRNIACQRFNIDEPLDGALFEYLCRRNKIGR